MKLLFWFLTIAGVLLVVMLFGNNLRCSDQKGVVACSDFCNSEPAKCDFELDEADCKELFDCHPPSMDQYTDMIDSYLQERKSGIIK